MRAVTKKIVSRVLTALIALSLVVCVLSLALFLYHLRWLSYTRSSPLKLVVDLATPGTYSAIYRQAAPAPGGLVQLFLDIPSRTESVNQSMLGSLAFDVDVYDSTNVNVYSNSFRTDSVAANDIWMLHNGFMINGVTLPNGDYSFALSVMQPTPSLVGIPHTLRAEYHRSLLYYLTELIGIITVVTALATIVLLLIRRAVRRASVDNEGRCVECEYDLHGNTSGRCPECGTPIESSGKATDNLLGSRPRFACPCCGYLTLPEPPGGTYDICPVCYWEDDPVQFRDPTYAGGANRESLEEARANFREFGACRKELVNVTRAPRPDEIP